MNNLLAMLENHDFQQTLLEILATITFSKSPKQKKKKHIAIYTYCKALYVCTIEL